MQYTIQTDRPATRPTSLTLKANAYRITWSEEHSGGDIKYFHADVPVSVENAGFRKFEEAVEKLYAAMSTDTELSIPVWNKDSQMLKPHTVSKRLDKSVFLDNITSVRAIHTDKADQLIVLRRASGLSLSA